MPNAFAEKPDVSEVKLPPAWTCPITGITVPKNPEMNLRWRKKLLKAAENDGGLQQQLMAASRDSILFFINAFVFTLRVFQTADSGDGAVEVKQADDAIVPFCSWPKQDETILEIEAAINGAYSLLTDKSRDMGASWVHLIVFAHQFIFRPNALFLVMSRVESGVDSGTNPKTLFGKLDILFNWLPEWMRPEIDRRVMAMANKGNGSRIDGESSNAAAGSGDRRRAVFLDEMAKMENGEKIKTALRDVAPCLLPCSTPWGAGTAYSKWRMSGKIKVVSMMWWDHPEKAAGLYVKQEEDTGKWIIRSPWYDHQCDIRTPQEVAQEIDANHIGSGATFFDGAMIEMHRKIHQRRPRTEWSIDFSKDTSPADVVRYIKGKVSLPGLLRRKKDGPLKVWPALIGGRLNQMHKYTIGADISKGQGASNSVLTVFCVDTGEKVAEWKSATIPPYDLARVAMALACWVGGIGRLPMIIWESQGPGWDFGRQIVQEYNYPKCWRDHPEGQRAKKPTMRLGWHSTRDKKEVVLGLYRRGLVQGKFINHSEAALDEALTYIYYESGGLGPAELVAESSDARKTHGDIVIADMLSYLGAVESGRPRRQGAVKTPANSWEARRKACLAKQNGKSANTTFDFS